jgi:uncharacterized ion transporter superfamily protein YfcC
VVRAVLEKSGAVRSALNSIGTSKRSDLPIIVGICVVFSLLGTVGAIINSIVAFVPIGLLLARSMNLSPLLGVALIYLGTYSGFNSAVLSPSTTALSQRLAELPIFSGLALRLVSTCFLHWQPWGFFIGPSAAVAFRSTGRNRHRTIPRSTNPQYRRRRRSDNGLHLVLPLFR